ncbi:MAG: ChbG/HpnK family deacetylase [Verrucomicrobiia bacterium]
MPTLFLRADDAGLSPGTNRAIDAASSTCLNLGLMPPAPFLLDAIERFQQRSDLCLGLHFTLNSEWPSLRWGPVSPPQSVPSLVQPDGTFYPNPWNLPPGITYDLNDIQRELHAQLDRLRSLGLAIRYLDSHMVVFHTRPDLAEFARHFAAREGLAYPDDLPRLSHRTRDSDLATNLQHWRHLLQGLDESPRLAIFHPAEADGLMESLQIDHQPVLPPRQAEGCLLASAEFKQLLHDHQVTSARLDSLTP